MTGRRVHERYDCDLPVRIVISDGQELEGQEVQTQTQNVSLGGMYLLAAEQVSYGTKVTVHFRLPALKQDTVCDGVVRWNKPDGFGVQFGSLRAIDVWGFHQLFKTLSPTPPAP